MSYTKLALELERKRLENLKKYVTSQTPTYQKRGTLIEKEVACQNNDSFKTIPYVIRYYEVVEDGLGIWTFSTMEYDSESHEIYENKLYDVVLNNTFIVMRETSKIAEAFSDYHNETLPIENKRKLIDYLHTKVVESNPQPAQNISYEETSTIDGTLKRQVVEYNSYSQSSTKVHNLATLDLIVDKINICSHDMAIIPDEVIEEFLSKQEQLEPRELSKITGFYDYNQKLENSAIFLDEGIVKVYNKK